METLYQPFPMPAAARGHIWHHAPETRRPRHFHAEPELNLITAGSARFGFGEAAMSVVAGDLLWWPPGQDHVLLDASPDFDLYVIGVSPGFSERIASEDGGTTSGGAARLALDPGLLARFTAVCAAPMSLGATAAVERHVGELWRDAHRLRVRSPDWHPLTRRTLASVLDRPELTRGELAELVHGNVSEVSRHFRHDIGLTLSEYRARLRLLRFIDRVERGQRLLAAAEEAGFGSYSQCHRVFQRTLACTPRLFFGSSLADEMRDRFAPWPAPRTLSKGLPSP